MASSREYSSCPTKNKRFINPHIEGVRRSLLDVLLWKTGYYTDPHAYMPAPDSFTFPVPVQDLNEQEPSALWINHSTFLIKIDQVHILTDPIWSQRCSPLTFFGPKRHHLPALELEELPKIDYVFISHNHYDHLDKKTVLELFALYPAITWIVPLGIKKWFFKLGISNVYELAWWETIDLVHHASETKMKATAVPSQHFSGVSGLDLNQTLWAGWVIECVRKDGSIKHLYFVGDTGYNPYDFKKIGQRWKQMDLSLIPIGSYLPRKFMSPVHIEPNDAVRIHQEVNSKLSLGMHWKTFRLSDEPLNQPPYDLYLALQKEGVDLSSFLALEPGHEINW